MSSELLAKLDSGPKVKMFDAFPKTRSMYMQRSNKGGALTLFISIVLLCLVWTDVRDYLYGEHGYSFEVDQKVGTEMQVNLDMTVAMKCHYLTIDVRDAVGDRLHISDSEFTKDGTTFEIGHAGRLDSVPTPDLSVGRTIDAAKKVKVPSFRKKNKKPARRSSAFKKTDHIVKDGPACRIFGSMEVKKVTGNLHITTLGHGYWSWEHTDHSLMNLSHVIHEFSFGPYFPDISQPLDSSVEITNEHFSVFQYFVNIVPTIYIDSRGRKLTTNQYSVTDYQRTVQHGQGVPGIFIKYDMEPLTMTIRERTTSFIQFLVRLAGVLGGVWVCTSHFFRVSSRIGGIASDVLKGREDLQSPESYASIHGSRSYGVGGDGMRNRPQYGEQRSSSGRWLDGAAQGGVEIFSSAREKAGQAWGNVSGGKKGHMNKESVSGFA